jgi:site-specific recombinase XerD
MMALMYNHGLRVSEVSALLLHNLVLSDPPTVRIEKGKGSKDRTVVLIDATLATLNTWLEARASITTRRSGLAMFLSLSKAGLGAPITPAGIRWVINRYLTATGLRRPGVSCHALRHAHASHALAGGADLYAVAREMGHASIETTTIYAHIVDAIEQNPAEFLHHRRL